ncbi:MAG: RHS repeat domain-containing protein [Verrucomicrobiales bacterium]
MSGVFAWDGENRLISATVNGTTTTYAYDFQGRRISKQTGGGQTVNYLYDGWNLIAEYTGNTLEKSYAWGMDLSGSMQGAGGVGGLLSVNDGSNRYYPTYDGNGNVSEYLDATGTVAAHYEYDPFGRSTLKNGAKADDFAHRFSTKPQDSETGLYYYGYRYYDPVTGRWPSRDPIEEQGGINLYAFVGNDAVSAWDLLGLEEMRIPVSWKNPNASKRRGNGIIKATVVIEYEKECENNVGIVKIKNVSVEGLTSLSVTVANISLSPSWEIDDEISNLVEQECPSGKKGRWGGQKIEYEIALVTRITPGIGASIFGITFDGLGKEVQREVKYKDSVEVWNKECCCDDEKED